MSSPTPIVSPPANSQPVLAINSTSPPPSTPSAQPPLQPPASSSPPPATRTSPPPSSTPSTPEATPPASSYSHPPPSNPTSPSKPGSSASTPPPSRTNSPPSKTPTTPGRSSPPPPKASVLPPLDSNNLSTGVVVVGVAIGALAILLILSILCICCAKKKRRRRDEEAYYMPPPPRPKRKALAFGGPPRRLQHNAPPPSDCVVKMMPKPSPLQPVASRPQQSPMYVPPPSPPKPCTNSGAGFGSNYSGSSNILPPPPLPCYLLGFSNSTFTFDELALATDGFSDVNLLGQGGFGYVHKGVLPNGKEIAVKQLKAGSGQGEREFQAEVEIISRVHHRHLVSLVGYCMSGYQRMLVYEFVPNNNLEFHLHGKGRPTMDFPTRLKIALGSAKGLAYLHEDCHPKIIHRDIKASNILLDFKFEAKVADFGLARITSDANTHVSTRVMGTFGYLAPEYASSGKLTDKSDVFSFGVMLLELITGRLPVDASQSLMEDSIVYWARPLLNRALDDRNFGGLVDPRL